MGKVKIFIFILGFIVFLSFYGSTKAQRGSFSASLDCPLDPQTNRIIIEFGNAKLRADMSEHRYVGPKEANVPAGTYKVTLASNDPAHPAQDAQTKEIWHLRLNNGYYQEVSSNPISDLPDDQVWKTQVVNNEWVIPFNATSATAVHSAFPTYGEANSIVPVCAALDRIGVSGPTPSPGSSPTPIPPPPPGASCSINIAPSSLIVPMGGTSFLYANITSQSGGSVNGVAFSSSNSSVADVTPYDSTALYRTTVSSVGQGNAVVTATAYMNGVAICNASATVQVGSPSAWWQAVNADVTTNGNLISLISNYCEEPACSPFLIKESAINSAGIAMYGGTNYDFSDNTIALGDPSVKGWLAHTSYAGPVYNYNYVDRFLPNDLVFNNIAGNINNGTFASGTPWNGYYWYKSRGNVTVNSPVTIPAGRKVILLVESGDLIINNTFNLTPHNNNFFLAVVQGNIRVRPQVDSNTRPALEGLFVADGTFQSGAGNRQLWVKGSVTAWGGFSLERDLGSANSNTPAELFEYNPSLMAYFPPLLNRDTVIWREVAP